MPAASMRMRFVAMLGACTRAAGSILTMSERSRITFRPTCSLQCRDGARPLSAGALPASAAGPRPEPMRDRIYRWLRPLQRVRRSAPPLAAAAAGGLAAAVAVGALAPAQVAGTVVWVCLERSEEGSEAGGGTAAAVGRRH